MELNCMLSRSLITLRWVTFVCMDRTILIDFMGTTIMRLMLVSIVWRWRIEVFLWNVHDFFSQVGDQSSSLMGRWWSMILRVRSIVVVFGVPWSSRRQVRWRSLIRWTRSQLRCSSITYNGSSIYRSGGSQQITFKVKSRGMGNVSPRYMDPTWGSSSSITNDTGTSGTSTPTNSRSNSKMIWSRAIISIG